MLNEHQKDEFGLYVIGEHGKIQHHQYLFRDGCFYIEERDGKFVLFDCGEYGDYIREDSYHDTLNEAYDECSTWA